MLPIVPQVATVQLKLVLSSTVKDGVRVSAAESFATVMVIVVEGSPAKIGNGAEAETTGVAGLTVSVAVVPVAPVPTGEEVMPVAPVVTVWAVESVTYTLMLHAPPGVSETPDTLSELAPNVAVTVPPQLFEAIVFPDTWAITRLDGAKESVKPMEFSVVAPPLLL